MSNDNERVKLISLRLNRAFKPTHLEVVDDSEKHIGHAGHQGGNRHFSIFISASELKALPRVLAHRKIYALFADMIPHQIHALRIKISD